MKAVSLALLVALTFVASSQAQESTAPSVSPNSNGPVIVVDYSNAKLSPSHWTLKMRPDGSGHFRSEAAVGNETPGQIHTPSVDRDVQLSPAFASTVFQAAQHHSFFNQDCESHMKVAYQGDKTLTYSGPDGKGSCTFNFSKDREIQLLGDNFQAVAETILVGVRLEMLLQHDPLGLNKEMENLTEAAESGRAQQICVIRSILERLAQDDHVLDLVRKRAKNLLARAET